MTDITIIKGSTFSRILRWESTPFLYRPVTAITKAAPASVTATAHGLPNGWRGAFVSIGGMREIRSKNTPPRNTDYHKLTVVDANTITVNDVDSTLYTAFTSGGYIQAYTPVSLASYTARMMIRPTIEDTATALLSLASPTNITIDDTAKTITVTITAAATAALTFSTGVFDIELVSGDATPVVTKLLSGNVVVQGEATRT